MTAMSKKDNVGENSYTNNQTLSYSNSRERPLRRVNPYEDKSTLQASALHNLDDDTLVRRYQSYGQQIEQIQN